MLRRLRRFLFLVLHLRVLENVCQVPNDVGSVDLGDRELGALKLGDEGLNTCLVLLDDLHLLVAPLVEVGARLDVEGHREGALLRLPGGLRSAILEDGALLLHGV